MNQILLKFLLGAAVVNAGLAHAGSIPQDINILGNQLLVKNPSTPEKRKVVVKAKEKDSPDLLVGNPVINGGNAYVRADGANPSEQIFALPQGTSSKGKPFWTGDATKGFTYNDSQGDNGPVKKAQIKKTSGGVFTASFQVEGKLGTVDIVPPNPGDGGCAALQLVGGAVYTVLFADGQMVNKGDTQFKVTKPTLQGTCFPPETTTTTSTSSSTSSTSSTTSTSTSVTTTTSNTTTTIFAGPAFPPVGGNVQFSFTGNAGNAGGADVNLFNFTPTSWTALFWGPSGTNVPAATLDGSLHVLSTFSGISGVGDTVATWDGTTPWTNPSDMQVYLVPIRFTLTITAGGLSFEPSTSIPGLDPGPGTGIDVVIDVAPGGTATNFTTNWAFTADVPTDANGYIPLNSVPTIGGGLTQNSFGGAFYSQQ